MKTIYDINSHRMHDIISPERSLPPAPAIAVAGMASVFSASEAQGVLLRQRAFSAPAASVRAARWASTATARSPSAVMATSTPIGAAPPATGATTSASARKRIASSLDTYKVGAPPGCGAGRGDEHDTQIENAISAHLVLCSAAFVLALGFAAVPARAQDATATTQAQPQYQAPSDQQLSEGQLDQLVAPIALYPDPLLTQVLMASTYPLEVVEAARWSHDNPGVTGNALQDAMQAQSWDPSVKALTAVPQTLQMMSDKLDWTQQLGDAFLAQQQDVMDAVQTLRAEAQAAGNLQSTAQQRVTTAPAPAGCGIHVDAAGDRDRAGQSRCLLCSGLQSGRGLRAIGTIRPIRRSTGLRQASSPAMSSRLPPAWPSVRRSGADAIGGDTTSSSMSTASMPSTTPTSPTISGSIIPRIGMTCRTGTPRWPRGSTGQTRSPTAMP